MLRVFCLVVLGGVGLLVLGGIVVYWEVLCLMCVVFVVCWEVSR